MCSSDLSGLADALVQVSGNLSAEILGGWHGGISFRLIATQVYPKGMAKAITNTTNRS